MSIQNIHSERRVMATVDEKRERNIRAYQRYAQLRDSKEYTDYRVCQMTGIATPTLTCWKAGEYMPKADKLLQIARLLGVPLEYLLGEET